MNQPMPALSPRRRNVALWIGLAFLLLTILTNIPRLYATFIPQPILPWISVIVPWIGLVFCLIGLKRAFSQSQIFGGKIGGSILTVIAVLFAAFSVLFFMNVRALPASAHAPQVGQKVPDFTLSSSGGAPMSLGALLSTPMDPSGKAPKAVLLVFYRGYW